MNKILLIIASTLLAILFLGVGIMIGRSEQVKTSPFIGELSSVVTETFSSQDENEEIISLDRSNRNIVEIKDDQSLKQGKKKVIVSLPQKCHFDNSLTPKHGGVFLSEVAWMGTPLGSENEWIELKNMSDAPADISLWELLDEDENIKIIFPQGTKIPSDSFFLLERKEDSVSYEKADTLYEGNLNNEGEALQLFNGKCELVDGVRSGTWMAGDNASKKTMERNLKSLAWHTSLIEGGTPRRENTVIVEKILTLSTEPPLSSTNSLSITYDTQKPSLIEVKSIAVEPQPSPEVKVLKTVGKVRISAIMVGDETSAENEYIKIFNTEDFAIDLTGWTLKKRSSTGTESSLVSAARLNGKSISSGDSLLFAHEGKYSGAETPDIWWPSSYDLAYKKNAVLLYNAEGQMVDEIAWEEIKKGEIYTR